MSQSRQRRGPDARTQNRNGARSRDSEGQSRPGTPELVSFVISAAIVVGLVGLVVYLHLTAVDKPALVVAQPMLDQVQQEGDLYYLPVEVTNRGGKAGEEVIVRVAVTHADGVEHVADVRIAFLAAGQVAEAIVALARDPRGARVEVATIGYLEPG